MHIQTITLIQYSNQMKFSINYYGCAICLNRIDQQQLYYHFSNLRIPVMKLIIIDLEWWNGTLKLFRNASNDNKIVDNNSAFHLIQLNILYKH